MDGSITVESRLGAGSTFTVTIPAVACDPPDPQITAVPPLAAAGQAVLVVDDNAVNQMLAASQLARLGLQAVVVGTGEAAVEMVAAGNGPDLILMDYQLPGIDGPEATRQIRELEAVSGHRSVIIGVTAAATAADRRACELAGMDDFLPKPVSLAVLGEALRRWVQHVPTVGELPDTVDASVLDSLAADLGDPAVVVDLVRTFLGELHGRRTALAEAAADGDVASAKRAAHTLKSERAAARRRQPGACVPADGVDAVGRRSAADERRDPAPRHRRCALVPDLARSPAPLRRGRPTSGSFSSRHP